MARARLRGPVFARAALVLLVVVGLDQLTKHTIAASVPEGETHKFLPLIDLVHVLVDGVLELFLGPADLVLARLAIAHDAVQLLHRLAAQAADRDARVLALAAGDNSLNLMHPAHATAKGSAHRLA